MICPICTKSMRFYTLGCYNLEDINIRLPIYYCDKCNSFIKKVDNSIINSFFRKSEYTNLLYEQKWYNLRIDFFKYIYTLIKLQNNSIINWLDYGCSYGFFIKFLNPT